MKTRKLRDLEISAVDMSIINGTNMNERRMKKMIRILSFGKNRYS